MLGKEYPLGYLTCFKGSYDHPYVLVDGLPLISVEYSYGKIVPEDTQRAELALQSYFDSEGKISIIPERYFSHFDFDKYSSSAPEGHYEAQMSEFDIDCVNDALTSVEPYNQFKMPHLVVVINDAKKFIVWDKGLMRLIASRFNERQSSAKRHRRITCEIPGFWGVLSGIVA